MKLSIVIVNYNSKEFLRRCLQSLADAKLLVPEDLWEVFVVDNNSQETLVSLKADRLFKPLKNWHLKLVFNRRNVGFAKANNQILKNTIGDYVLLLNPDTLVPQTTIPKLIAYLEKNPEVALVTPRVELPDGEIDDACHRGFPTPWRALTYFSGLGKLFPHSQFFNGYHLGYRHLETIHEIEAAVGACMLVRRSAGAQVNWLDEDYFWYGEDLDFCYRLKQAGYKIVFNPEVKITHFKGVSSGIKKQSASLTAASTETRRQAQQARFQAMRLFYEKHYQPKASFLTTLLVRSGIAVFERIKNY